MRILAVKGTPFERTINTMYKNILQAKDVMMGYVKEYLGVEPRLIECIEDCGIICKFIPVFDFYIDDRDKLDFKIIIQRSETKDFVPNISTLEGRRFSRTFEASAILMQVTDDILHKYGIRMVSPKTHKCYSIFPDYDEELHAYYLECSDDIEESFGDDLLCEQMFCTDKEL